MNQFRIHIAILLTLATFIAARAELVSNNSIDQFIRKRQQDAGVQANPPADRATLIRRVSFDLTGLPPTPDEVDAFIADRSPEAYAQLVERLLSSPRYGERMAQFWLDLARYADSDGYHDDTNRSMWPYRDYVIDSFNSNKPFDEFTVEQLAGDLIPNPTLEQRVATAFHRNGPTSSEDGANPDEYRARYAVDRVNTTSQVWLGLTVQCAECHDHKYDPISTKEYYQLFAFFNQTNEQPLFRGLHAPPSIAVPDERAQAKLRLFDAQIESKKSRLQELAQSTNSDFLQWRSSLEKAELATIPRETIACEYLFDEPKGTEGFTNSGTRRRAAKLVRAGEGTDQKNARPISKSPWGDCLQLEGDSYVDLGRVFEVRAALPFTIEAWVRPSDTEGKATEESTSKENAPLFSTIDYENNSRGFELRLINGRLVIRLVDAWPDAAIQISTINRLESQQWTHLSLTFDGRLSTDAFYIYVNGQPQDLSIDKQAPLKTIRNRRPFLVGGDSNGSFHGQMDEIRFYKWPLSDTTLTSLPVVGLRQLESEQSTELLRNFFLSSVHLPSVDVRKQRYSLERKRQLFAQELPRVRIMQDQHQTRPTHILQRGDFRDPGELVDARTPEMLPPLPPLATSRKRYTRLDLANWLVEENKLHTAKVLANRLWALLFGRGLVSTLDDFGVMGADATHPELLDWMRDELLRTDWDVKSLIRQIVLSATYRQSSRVNSEANNNANNNPTKNANNNDPTNELLTRGPRYRRSAEMIRDNALAVSGLLSNRIGGASVRPYQPPGLWREMSKGDEAAKQYEQSHGESLYRRGIYTFWKRSIHYPSFAVLDAPNREVCTSSRPITNTPAQALTMLNDPTFVEAARVFASRYLPMQTTLILGSSSLSEPRLHVQPSREK